MGVPEFILDEGEDEETGEKMYLMCWVGKEDPKTHSWEPAHTFDDNDAYAALVAEWEEWKVRDKEEQKAAKSKKNKKKRS